MLKTFGVPPEGSSPSGVTKWVAASSKDTLLGVSWYLGEAENHLWRACAHVAPKISLPHLLWHLLHVGMTNRRYGWHQDRLFEWALLTGVDQLGPPMDHN